MADVYVDMSHQATRLLDLADLREGQAVLDAGCGPGTVTVIAAERVGAAGRVIGVDLAPKMVDRATEATRSFPNVTIREMDAAALEFPDASFDVVVANSVVQFSGPNSLPEWKRVVRPDGGRVACSLPWGPAFWFELCRRYVHRTSEPFRSAFARRLDAPLRSHDAEAARARHGFAAVVEEIENFVRRYDSPEDAWRSEYAHGARVFLEELPEEALAEFKAAYVEAVRTDDGGAEIAMAFHYWCFTR